MSFIRDTELTISTMQRIQIKSESNFSFDVLNELIRLRPIEVNVRLVGNECTVRISTTHGLSATVLADSDSYLPFFADIDSQHYQRLNLDVSEDEQTWIISFYPAGGYELNSLATQPIVIKVFERPGKGHSLIFAANSSFKVAKSNDNRLKNIVYDPSKIPEALLRMVEVIDEPLPENRISLELLKERTSTIKRLLERHQGKQVQLSVKEEIELTLAELSDFESKVDAKIEGLRFGTDGIDFVVFQKMATRLRQVLGGKKFESALAGIYREVRQDVIDRQKSEQFLTEGNIYESILSNLDDFGANDDVLKILNGELHKSFFAHTCGKCGANSVVKRDGNKYLVECEQCDNRLDSKNISRSRASSIAFWNKANPTENLDCWLVILGGIGITVDDQEVRQKKILHTLMAMMKYWKDTLPSESKTRPEFGYMQETLEMIKFLKGVLTKKEITGG